MYAYPWYAPPSCTTHLIRARTSLLQHVPQLLRVSFVRVGGGLNYIRCSPCAGGSFCPMFARAVLWLGVRTGELLAQLEERLAGAWEQAVRACVQQPSLRQLRFMHDLPGAMLLQFRAQTVYQRVGEAAANGGPLVVHTCNCVHARYGSLLSPAPAYTAQTVTMTHLFERRSESTKRSERRAPHVCEGFEPQKLLHPRV